MLETPRGLTISPIKMEKELNEDDWDKIIKRYYDLKKEHVEVLIDLFVRPDLYKTMDGSENLKDYFINRIQRRLQENKGSE